MQQAHIVMNANLVIYMCAGKGTEGRKRSGTPFHKHSNLAIGHASYIH